MIGHRNMLEIMPMGLRRLKYPAPYAFVNDVEIGIYAGTKAGWGVAVDAGTGNNVRGRDETGRTGRITGNSARILGSSAAGAS